MKKILLDENLPRRLKDHFSKDFEILTVSDLGWQSKKNGELLEALDEQKIDFLLTVDKSLRYQQNLEKYDVFVAVLFTFDNRLKTLLPNVSNIESEIRNFDTTEKVLEINLRES